MTDFLVALRKLLIRLSSGPADTDVSGAWSSLLQALVQEYPIDAATLMVADGDAVRPVAVFGLSDEVRGRRFELAAHPRLATIAAHDGVCRFAPDSRLPDPFDGLLDADLSQVHDCVGVALRDGERLTGMLTLDGLVAGRLEQIDDGALLAEARLLGTCLRLAEQLSRARNSLHEVLSGGREPPLQDNWNSPVMQRLQEAIMLVAPTDMTVLLCGETGVGKERVVRSLHQQSGRREGPLIQVNCGALPEALIESELFGHTKGAFSGAIRDRQGHFALADGGTLMLDEIGELPLALQPRLLRVLQEGDIHPLGSDAPRKVDVRVIAVTNRDLAEEVRAGRFREDLYHRLSVYPLRVAPLRERMEDLPLLVGHFLEENRVRLGVANLRLTAAAQTAMMAWHWPGNVRELEHTLARAALQALGLQRLHAEDRRHQVVEIDATQLTLPETGAVVQPAATPLNQSAAKEQLDLRSATDAFQRQHIQQALRASDGNWAAAARRLAMDPGNLHRLARRLQLK